MLSTARMKGLSVISSKNKKWEIQRYYLGKKVLERKDSENKELV